MVRLEKIFRFEAAHMLPQHDGKCARLHGHSWVMRVAVEQDESRIIKYGPKSGMIIDYGEISHVVKPLVEEYLDHRYLNDSLKMKNPTSENIAIWLYDKIKASLPLVSEIIIEETCTSRCVYRPEKNETITDA